MTFVNPRQTLSRAAVSAAVLALLAGAAPSLAQLQAEDKTVPGMAPATTNKPLNPGDKAPALKIDKWLKGTEVTAFEKDKVYVVEFWATWCGPCIQGIPHLTELQAKHKDKGLTIISVSIDQKRMEALTPFMERRGKDMGYTVALDATDGATAKAYLTASGVTGIPHAYVIDKQGRMVWHGHPMEMDPVLEQTLAGTFDPDKYAASQKAFAEKGEKFQIAFKDGKFDEAIAILRSVVAEHPEQADMARVTEVSVLMQGKKDKAGAMALGKQLADGPYKDNAKWKKAIVRALFSGVGMTTEDYKALLPIANSASDLAKNADADTEMMLSDVQRLGGDLSGAVATLKRYRGVAEESQKPFLDMRIKQLEEDAAKPAAPASSSGTPAETAPAKP